MSKIAKLLAIAALASGSSAFAGPPKWKVSESSGTVNLLRAGVSKIAISGRDLRIGDVIATGKKSRAVLVRGQEYVVVSPNSRLRIAEPKQSGGIVQFFEEIGNVIFRIDKKATPHFGVKTPYLAAVVKGTTFSVTVSETGTAVQVTEGAVQVSTLDGGASQLLSPGMIGMVTNDQQFQLSITGAETKTIVSPNAPAKNVGDAELSQSEPDASSDAVSEVASAEVATGNFDGVISAPVAEKPVSLGKLTGGLITNGAPTLPTTQIAFNDAALPDFTGGANGNPGAVGNGNGNPNGGQGNNNGNLGDGAGNGSGNDGGTGNDGSGSENGNGSGDNGGGNGNGNNGNGNGNGGSNGSGDNGGGNGNGNNGNGNGNGGSNGSGDNGGGNGNGNNGNGNGNGGSNGSGDNGGGNGNGNNGNGNGNGGSNGSGDNGGGNGNGNNGNGNGNGGSNGSGDNGGGNGNGNNGNGNGNGGGNKGGKKGR